MRVTSETSATSLMRLGELGREQAQRVVVVAFAPQRHRQDRHVVDRARLDQRTDDARGDAIGVRRQLLIQADERPRLVLADIEAHDDHRRGRDWRWSRGTRRRDLPEQLLQRSGDALLDFGRRGAGHLHEDVDHRHDDLRLFLARQRQHRERAERDRAAMKSGVSGERMKAAARRPAAPVPVVMTVLRRRRRRGWPRRHRRAVAQAGCRVDDDGFAFGEPGPDLGRAIRRAAGIDEAQACAPAVDHEDAGQLAVSHHGAHRGPSATAGCCRQTPRARTCRT